MNNQQPQQQNNKHFYTYLNATAVGRLTRDPEVKTNGQNNSQFYDFSIAVNHQNGETSFIDCSVNGNNTFLANKVQHLKKGRQVLVTGVMQLKPKGEGKVGSYVSIRPDQLMFLDNEGTSQGQGQQQQQTPFSGGQQGQQQQYAPQGQQQYAPQGQQQQPYGQPQGQPQQYAQQQPYGQPQGQPGFAPQQGAPQQPFGAPQQNPFAQRG